MLSTEIGLAVKLEGVSVRYRIPHERIPSIKEFAISWLHRRIRIEDFWALRGIDLEVHNDEVFGIVGPNGAGKSTLLKVVARVLRPTNGRTRVWGRVAPLLELGAGFDNELTGRENIFLSGTTLGFSKRDLSRRVDHIIEFSELEEFIDAPLRTYSSGMRARLGFAIATDVKPDVLLLDEVLAVGDAAFRDKCGKRIRGFLGNGTAVLMVSHDPEAIKRLCHRAALLQRGEIVAVGTPAEVLESYRLVG
jgi:ABC-2 type transport system ATP-binding protein